ncbi:biorientation of chromosomes in cell division protein 1-like 1 isoform X2 [Scaptodrosophila lebanonensis]|uniref:Biorientation of chromosomes in cell division protein 1-like 1 isoform X2 n=1 Tax=Drosophila lebanonensis TaxID=7225 RepID=A0A6J2T666_DROLE|nr:biorientation of chromosomes in cell division protein 1-like 1 isoform X2 [Scaptodrosophila lebanonensis]
MDADFVKSLVQEVKSQGVFDEFRKDALADVDTKPAYQNVRNRVETAVRGFLSKQTWTTETNKVQLREKLRKHLLEADVLDKGVDHIVDQVVNPKVATVFEPKIQSITYKYLGIAPPPLPAHVPPPRPPLLPAPPLPPYASHLNGANMLRVETTASLLPTDLEQISPDSDRATVKSDLKDDSKDDDLPPGVEPDDHHYEDDTSPSFEPLSETKTLPNESIRDGIINGTFNTSDSANKELVNDSRDAGVSQTSQLSQVSSDSRLTIGSTESAVDVQQPTSNSIELTPNIAANISEEAQMPKFNENSSDTSSGDVSTGRQLHFDIMKDTITFEGTERKNSMSEIATTNGSGALELSIEDAIMSEVKANIDDANNAAIKPDPEPPNIDTLHLQPKIESPLLMHKSLQPPSTSDPPPLPPNVEPLPLKIELPPSPPKTDPPLKIEPLPSPPKIEPPPSPPKAEQPPAPPLPPPNEPPLLPLKVELPLASPKFDSQIENGGGGGAYSDGSQHSESLLKMEGSVKMLAQETVNDESSRNSLDEVNDKKKQLILVSDEPSAIKYEVSKSTESTTSSASTSSHHKKHSRDREKDKDKYRHRDKERRHNNDDKQRSNSRDRDRSRDKTHSKHSSSSSSKHSSSSSKHKSTKHDKSSLTSSCRSSSTRDSSSAMRSTSTSSSRHESSSSTKKPKSTSSSSRSDSRSHSKSHSHSRSHNNSSSSSSKRSDRDRQKSTTSSTQSAAIQDDHNELKSKIQKRRSSDSNDEGKPPGAASSVSSPSGTLKTKEKNESVNSSITSDTNEPNRNGAHEEKATVETALTSSVVVVSDILKQSPNSFIDIGRKASEVKVGNADGTKFKTILPQESEEQTKKGEDQDQTMEVTCVNEREDISAKTQELALAHGVHENIVSKEEQSAVDGRKETEGNPEQCAVDEPKETVCNPEQSPAAQDNPGGPQKEGELQKIANKSDEEITTYFEENADEFKQRLELIRRTIEQRRIVLNVLGQAEAKESRTLRRSTSKRRLSSDRQDYPKRSSIDNTNIDDISPNSSTSSENVSMTANQTDSDSNPAKRLRCDEAKTSPTFSEASVNSKENEALDKHDNELTPYSTCLHQSTSSFHMPLCT